MGSIHEEINHWLSADLDNQLSQDERAKLRAHLAECSACRQLFEEDKAINKLFEEKLESLDPTLEQRMVAGFRNRVPVRTAPFAQLAELMRRPVARIAAVAIALIALLQVGKMIVNENRMQSPKYATTTTRGGRIESKQMVGTPQSALPPPSVTATPLFGSASPTPNQKLIRRVTVKMEIVRFDQVAPKITALANEEKGYVATTSSQEQENGKLEHEIVVKLLPENLDRFLQKLRGLGEVNTEVPNTEDITKEYLHTEGRLRLTLSREQEEGHIINMDKIQADLKSWDAQVQFATVTISLSEQKSGSLGGHRNYD